MKKKMHNLKSENYILFGRTCWGFQAWDTASQINLMDCFEPVREEPGYIGVLQQKPGSLNIKRLLLINENQGLPRWCNGKEASCQCRRCMFDPWVGKIPWYPGKSHRQRSLAGYSPWGHKELDAAEHTHTHKENHTSQITEFSASPWRGRCKSLGSRKSFLCSTSQLAGASTRGSPTLSPLRALRWRWLQWLRLRNGQLVCLHPQRSG